MELFDSDVGPLESGCPVILGQNTSTQFLNLFCGKRACNILEKAITKSLVVETLLGLIKGEGVMLDFMWYNTYLFSQSNREVTHE